MSSFYGGKQGRTYNIVKRYDSVRQMVQAFANGGAYTEVNYGQYVLIDTILNNNHKSDLENGLLFRRGFDYNDPYSTIYVPKKEDKDSQGNYIYKDVNGNLDKEKWQSAWMTYVTHVGAGAIYVGQIVGPQGESPQITPIDWNSIKDQAEVKKVIPVSNTKGNDSTLVKDNNGNDIWNGDAIKVASVTIIDNDGNITGAKIAFDIPEEIFVVSAQSVDAYGNSSRIHYDDISNINDTVNINAEKDKNTGQWKYTNLIHEHSRSGINAVDEEGNSFPHPFYHNLDIAIPKGIHGQNIEQIKIESVEDINQDVTDPIVIDNKTVFPGDQYFTYKIKNFNNRAAGDETDHLGRWPYRVINTIYPNDKTRNTITWEHGYEVKLGDLYRTNEYPSNYYWVCIKSGILDIENSNDELGDIVENPDTHKITPDIGTTDSSLYDTVWRVVTIPQTAPVESLTVDYKAGPSQTIDNIRTVDHLVVDREGKMYVLYSTSDQLYYLTTLNTIEYITFVDDETDQYYGKVVLKYYGQDRVQLFDAHILEKVEFNNQTINLPQYFSAKFKGEEPIPISKNINTVLAFDRFGSDNMYILYSDPNIRDNLPKGSYIIRDWVDPTDPTGNTKYYNLKWYNLGPLGAQYHVQGQYTLNDLKTTLIYGFDQIKGIEDRAGWLVTVMEIIQGQEGQEDKIIPHIYAFDYNNYKEDPNNPGTLLPPSHQLYDGTASYWYQIMSLNESAIDPKRTVQIAKIESDLEKKDTLQDGMLWFVSSVGHDNYRDSTSPIQGG